MRENHSGGGSGFVIPLRVQGRALLGIPEAGVFVSLVAAVAVIGLLNPALFASATVASVLRTMSFIGIVVVGQAMLIAIGEFDMSVGSVAGASAVIAGALMAYAHWPIPLAVLVGLGVGVLAGVINGIVTVKIGVPAFMATLGMLYVGRGVASVVSGGNPVYPLPPEIAQVESVRVLGLPLTVWVMVIVVVVGDIALRRTGYGRRVYATGSNQLAARLSGIRTDRLKIAVFALTGFLAALSGILVAVDLKRADTTIGQGWEFFVIASAIIGGVSLGGGIGTVAGAFLGLALLQVIITGVVLVGVDPFLQATVTGFALLAAATFDVLRRRNQR